MVTGFYRMLLSAASRGRHFMLASRASIAPSSLSQWTRGKASLLISFLTLLYYVLTLLIVWKKALAFQWPTQRAERRPASHADVLRGSSRVPAPRTRSQISFHACFLSHFWVSYRARARGFTTYAPNGQLPRRLSFYSLAKPHKNHLALTELSKFQHEQYREITI